MPRVTESPEDTALADLVHDALDAVLERMTWRQALTYAVTVVAAAVWVCKREGVSDDMRELVTIHLAEQASAVIDHAGSCDGSCRG